VKIYTAHARAHPGAGAVLVPERFSWLAAVFGPLWLFAGRAWIAGVLALCAEVALAALLPGGAAAVALAALHWLLGLQGQDVRRWSLERRGFTEVHVIAARDEEDALARLFDRRPDLIRPTLGLEMGA